MCLNIGDTVSELREKGVEVIGEPMDEGYGVTVMLNLPGNCPVVLYEPRQPVAI